MTNVFIPKIIKSSSKYIHKTPNYIDFLETKSKNLENQDRYYDKTTRNYPKKTIWDLPYYRSTNQTEISFLGEVKSKLILDLGSGIGEATQLLLRKNALVVSLDSSEKCLKISQKVNKNLHIRADATNLPFKNCVFDIIFGREILHHLDEKKCLVEVKRVLKKGGYAVFEEPLKFNLLIVLYRFIKKNERVSQHSFSPGYLSKLSTKYFRECEKRSFYTIFPIFLFFIMYIPKIENILSKVYVTLFSRFDDVVSNHLPLFSWLQVVKFTK